MGIYYNGSLIDPVLNVPHDIYDSVSQVSTSGLIELIDTVTVYNYKPTSNSTLTFSTTNLESLDSKYVNFMLVIDFTDNIYTINWPSNVQWGNISPTMTANAKYMFSFTKPAGENVWIGNQMFSWI